MAKAAKKATSKTPAAAPKKRAAKPVVAETNILRRVSMRPVNKNIQTFSSGDTVNVYVKVKEGEKERVQVYKGLVIRLQGSGAMRSFTVRKISAGVGVERTFPFSSPALDRVELVSIGQVRRSKLYYLRDLDGKAAKIDSELATARDIENATN